MKRRKIDAETKMAAVLEGLKGESSVAEICRKYQISESLTTVGGTSFWRVEVEPWLLGMVPIPTMP